MKKRKALLFAATLMAVGFFTTGIQGDTVYAEEATTIANGVYIGNVDVSGMTEIAAKEAVQSYLDGIMGTTFTLTGPNGTMTLTAEDMGVTADVDTAVEKAIVVAHSGDLITRYKETCDLQQSTLTVDLNLTIDKQATAQKIYEQADSLNIEAMDNGLTMDENGDFQFVAGQTGQEVDIVNSVYAIDDFLQTWNQEDSEIALVATEVEPRGSQEELAQVKDCLGSFSTDFSSSAPGRWQNVSNGCSRVNGTIVYPGDEFSMYQTVSPFTEENGYEIAGAYQNGQVIESLGGGICQVATTLYNAVLRAELDVTMRYNHSMLVSYVDPSDDAAIAGTYKDLRFVNDSEYPIYIQGYTSSSGIITFKIYGVETRDTVNRKVSFESEVISQEEPTYQWVLDGTAAAGSWHTMQSAHLGTVAKLWKIVTVNGEEESRECVNSSTYSASPKIVNIGTMGATPEQLAALNAAIATNDEATIRAACASVRAGGTGAVTADPAATTTPEVTTPTTTEPTTDTMTDTTTDTTSTTTDTTTQTTTDTTSTTTDTTSTTTN